MSRKTSAAGKAGPAKAIRHVAYVLPALPQRLFFIDNLRAFLAILVVLHNLTEVYLTGVLPFYFEAPQHGSTAWIAATTFLLTNNAWFMGTFFFLSGYFSPGSFDRKGPRAFLKDRLLRLGIPLLAYYFVLRPLASFFQEPAHGITAPITWHRYFRHLGLGPLWFVAVLMLFTLAYIMWRTLTAGTKIPGTGGAEQEAPLRAKKAGQRPAPASKTLLPVPGYRAIGLFCIALALVTFVVRARFPMGRVEFGFINLCYLPQYISFFILGTTAYRNNWLQGLPNRTGWTGLGLAGAALVILYPLAFWNGDFTGSGHWPSAVYSLFDSAFAVGMCLGLVTLFRHLLNYQNATARFFSQQAYAVYIIHVPIIILLAVTLRGISLETSFKLGVTAVMVIAFSYAAAYCIRKMPFVTKVL